MRKNEIDRLALNIAIEHQTRNPFTICDNLGVHVIYVPFVDLRGLCQREDGVSFIYIADNLPEYVSEFICGHELGHHIRHRGINRIFMDSSTYEVASKYEYEADRFACQLLYAVPPLYNDRALTDWQLAECLNVPKINLDSKLLEMGIYQ